MVCMERTAMRHMIIDDDDDVYDCIGERIKLEGETENMCVWTKKRGSMKAEVLMATPCPKSLHGKGEKWIARNILQGFGFILEYSYCGSTVISYDDFRR